MTSLKPILEDPSGGRKEWKESEYAVYRYLPNQETIDREGSNETRKPGAGFSLTLVGSSISSDREHLLREHVGTRMSHSTLYRSTGQVTTLDPELFPPSSQSYYCLIEVNVGGSKDEEDVGKSSSLFLVCFMSIGKQGLDLTVCLSSFVYPQLVAVEIFRTELDTFCETLLPLLKELPEEDPSKGYPGSKLETKITNWFSENIAYLSRVIQRCQKQLPVLLHTAVDSSVEVTGDDKDAVKDTKQFLDACSLANLMQFNSQGEPGEPPPSNLIKITVTKDDCHVTAGESNKFCLNWAQVLLAQGTVSPDPFFLRQAVENYKLKIIQDINALKRLVRQAETDYHSLYRCYVFMCMCGNGHLLLKCALQEAQSMDSPDTLAVLEAIKLYSDKHGFRDTNRT